MSTCAHTHITIKSLSQAQNTVHSLYELNKYLQRHSYNFINCTKMQLFALFSTARTDQYVPQHGQHTERDNFKRFFLLSEGFA